MEQQYGKGDTKVLAYQKRVLFPSDQNKPYDEVPSFLVVRHSS